MNDLLQQLCAAPDRLKHVNGCYYDCDGRPILTAITLRFERGMVSLEAQADDSIAVSDTSKVLENRETAKPLDGIEPWKSAISKPLFWAWRMINQQGYIDGIQLDFGEGVDRPVTRIQLLVVASEIKIQKSFGATS